MNMSNYTNSVVKLNHGYLTDNSSNTKKKEVILYVSKDNV
jgi:hypothetical protein